MLWLAWPTRYRVRRRIEKSSTPKTRGVGTAATPSILIRRSSMSGLVGHRLSEPVVRRPRHQLAARVRPTSSWPRPCAAHHTPAGGRIVRRRCAAHIGFVAEPAPTTDAQTHGGTSPRQIHGSTGIPTMPATAQHAALWTRHRLAYRHHAQHDRAIGSATIVVNVHPCSFSMPDPVPSAAPPGPTLLFSPRFRKSRKAASRGQGKSGQLR